MIPIGRGQRADHRRPPDGARRRRARHDHQQQGLGAHLRLRRDRPAHGDRGAGGGDARGTARSTTIIVAALRRRGGPDQNHGAVRRRRPSLPPLGRASFAIYDDLTSTRSRTARCRCCCPPGREGLPGDVFYPAQPPARAGEAQRRPRRRLAHPRCRSSRHQAGDVSAYIPTNVISITDGQIFLESKLFNSGVRPPSTSVSRCPGSVATRRRR